MTETESAWSLRIAAWRASGESARTYGARIGFAPATLRWWSSELGRRGIAVPEAGPEVRLARVQVRSTSASAPRSESGVRLTVGSLGIAVERGFDVDVLRAVLAAAGVTEAR